MNNYNHITYYCNYDNFLSLKYTLYYIQFTMLNIEIDKINSNTVTKNLFFISEFDCVNRSFVSHNEYC